MPPIGVTLGRRREQVEQIGRHYAVEKHFVACWHQVRVAWLCSLNGGARQRLQLFVRAGGAGRQQHSGGAPQHHGGSARRELRN